MCPAHTLSSSHPSHPTDLDEVPPQEAYDPVPRWSPKYRRSRELGLGCLGFKVTWAMQMNLSRR